MAGLLTQIDATEATKAATARANQERWAQQKAAKHVKMLTAFVAVLGLKVKVKEPEITVDGMAFFCRPGERGYDGVFMRGVCPQCGNETYSREIAHDLTDSIYVRKANEKASMKRILLTHVTDAIRPQFRPNNDHWKMCSTAFELRDQPPEAVEAWVRWASRSGDDGMFARNGFFAGWHARNSLLEGV